MDNEPIQKKVFRASEHPEVDISDRSDLAEAPDEGLRAQFMQLSARERGMLIASLVCSILAIVLSFFSTLNWVGLVFGVAALVLGILCKKQVHGSLATAVLVCSIVGFSIVLIVWLISTFVFGYFFAF